MTSSSVCTLENTRQWFLKAVPNPTSKNISTQIGCHLEEVAEMLNAITSNNLERASQIEALRAAIDHVGSLLKKDNNIVIKDSVELLDALADQIVTATGVGTFLGMNVPGALAEVNRSNYSKFDEDGNPIFNENMKVMKGPHYTKPDLKPYI